MDLRLVFKISDSELTINGLIQGLKKNCPELHGTIISTLMKALEEQSIAEKLSRESERNKFNGHQSKPRKLRSSLETIVYQFSQLVDRKMNRTFAPLVGTLSIPSHDHILEEATEGPIGLMIHVSYRRVAQEVERISGQSMSHTTLHHRLQRWAQEHCPFGENKNTPFRFFIVDGTKVHLQGPWGQDLGQAEMVWALASEHSSGPFEPVGFWNDTEGAHIRKDLEQRLEYSKTEVLFSGGGPGIEENLLRPGMEHQRCLWHGKRDFPYLLYADGAKNQENRPLVEKLKSLPLMRLTKSKLEQFRPEDHPRIEALITQTQQGLQELLEALDPKKYQKAHTYIENLIHPVTTFFRWWLHKGKLIPLNTNTIESAFGQVCNRIKKVGRRWSDRGLLNWFKIAFYKTSSNEVGSVSGGKPQYWGFPLAPINRILFLK